MKQIHKFLYVVSIFLVIGFFVRLGVDYWKYDSINDSAPFYVFVVERAVEFVVPSIIVWITGKIAKKKYEKEQS